MSAGNGAAPAPSLARRLQTRDAVFVGLGAMLGAGVFAAFAPAAQAAGSALLIGLAIAGCVAYCNATSSAQLAAAHPQAGGTYVYGRERLGHVWGYLAGWSFVAGKTGSCAVMALTLGAYAWPEAARVLAVGAVILAVGTNLRGIERTAAVTRVIVVLVLAALAAGVAAALLGGTADLGRLTPASPGGPLGVLESAGLLFFAFAGYARMATLGEEAQDPARTLVRAIPLALGIVLVVYALVGVAVLAVLGAGDLASAQAPLAEAARSGELAWLEPAVRAGAVIASFGVLLSLLAGVGRTTFAMARDGELPRRLAHVHPRHRVPDRAEAVVAALVCGLVAFADLREAIGFSSFLVLVYYAVANASALAIAPAERHWPRWLAMAGLGGCLLLAVSLPPVAVLAGAGVLGAGLALRVLRRR